MKLQHLLEFLTLVLEAGTPVSVELCVNLQSTGWLYHRLVEDSRLKYTYTTELVSKERIFELAQKEHSIVAVIAYYETMPDIGSPWIKRIDIVDGLHLVVLQR